jgi:serine/threonine protein kinase
MDIGPVRWMAPESLATRKYSKKSDVWSFGIVGMFDKHFQQIHSNSHHFLYGKCGKLFPSLNLTWILIQSILVYKFGPQILSFFQSLYSQIQ